MPQRKIVARELSELLGVLAHPLRLRLVLELRDGEHDVNELARTVEAGSASVSQQLAILRAHRLVAQRRGGRHVYYHLLRPELARWLTDGLLFLEDTLAATDEVRDAIRKVRRVWDRPANGRSR